MSTRQLARRLLAYGEGRALPAGTTKHLPIAPDSKIVMIAFVRMGGESAPWAVGVGKPKGSRQLFAVPEPRRRDSVAQMMANVSPLLVQHLARAAKESDPPELVQFWLPNDSHLEMLHFVAYSYTFARQADPAILPDLNRIGRAANWLFQDAQWPGETLVIPATTFLRESFTFPAEESRQQHLGFLLEWLHEQGTRSSRQQSAFAAELTSVSSSLDPEIERKELEPLVSRWNELDRQPAKTPEVERVGTEIRKILHREVGLRLDAVERAIDRLRRDPRPMNAGAVELIARTARRLQRAWPAIERGAGKDDDGARYVLSPRTDSSPQFAADRFFDLEESYDAWVSLLIHSDRDMQDDAIAEGDAFRGVVESVRDEMEGRTRWPIWEVVSTSEGPLRLREGSEVCVAGCKSRVALIDKITPIPTGGRRFTLVIHSGKRACEGEVICFPAAHDPAHVRMNLTFVQTYPSQIHLLKRKSLWAKDKPGAWIHALGRTPPREEAPVEDDA